MFFSGALLLFSIFLQIPFITASKNAKRGLAFADADSTGSLDVNKANTSNSVVSWQYNWGATPPNYLSKSGIPYIPMQWGAGGIENFASQVKAQGAKTILVRCCSPSPCHSNVSRTMLMRDEQPQGFNEPDLAGQSNINATYAAALWKKYINPLSASGVRLGAPAVSNAPGGRPWLAAFLAACSGCRIDFIPFHWYGTGAQNFNNYISQMHAQFPNWPLWVTEFASTSMDDTGGRYSPEMILIASLSLVLSLFFFRGIEFPREHDSVYGHSGLDRKILLVCILREPLFRCKPYAP
jgi:hypothetical protein